MDRRQLFGITCFDPPKGETKTLIDKLIELKRWGKNQGADESIAVLEILAHLEKHPYLNAFTTEQSPIWALIKEFGQAFFPNPSGPNKLLEHLVTKHQWEKLDTYLIGFSTATHALTASLQAHGVEGGEVITPSYNYLAAPNAIVTAGAKPRFVDIDPKSFCMDAASCLKAIRQKTKAILLVHVNQAVDLLPLVKGLEKKKREDIAIIQDCSTAIGSKRDGLGVGQVSPPPHGVSVLSLGPIKVISGLGGALVASQNIDHLRKIEAIGHHGTNPVNHDDIVSLGTNYKMNELCMAIAFEQVKKKEAILERRQKTREMYDRALEPLIRQGRVTLQENPKETVLTHYMLKLDRSYLEVMLQMGKRFQIVCSHWWHFHLDPVYRLQFGSYSLPVTEAVADKILFLPFNNDLTEENVEYIVKGLTSVLS